MLDPSSSSHAIRSLRLGKNDPVLVSDGAGILGRGYISAPDPKHTEIYIDVARLEALPKVQLHLVQALAKNDRDLLAVETSTELGVDAVTPWQAQRSIVRLRAEKLEKLHLKWQAKIVAAAQQSRRVYIPVLHDPLSGTDISASVKHQDKTAIFMLHEEGDTNLIDAATQISEHIRSVQLIVGPEGGITDAEVESVRNAGGKIVRIGKRIMRSSTAGPVAIALLNQHFDRW